LPLDVKRVIFEMDPTYRDIYKTMVNETFLVPQQLTENNHDHRVIQFSIYFDRKKGPCNETGSINPLKPLLLEHVKKCKTLFSSALSNSFVYYTCFKKLWKEMDEEQLPVHPVKTNYKEFDPTTHRLKIHYEFLPSSHNTLTYYKNGNLQSEYITHTTYTPSQYQISHPKGLLSLFKRYYSNPPHALYYQCCYRYCHEKKRECLDGPCYIFSTSGNLIHHSTYDMGKQVCDMGKQV
jgi:hypothetical protein